MPDITKSGQIMMDINMLLLKLQEMGFEVSVKTYKTDDKRESVITIKYPFLEDKIEAGIKP